MDKPKSDYQLQQEVEPLGSETENNKEESKGTNGLSESAPLIDKHGATLLPSLTIHDPDGLEISHIDTSDGNNRFLDNEKHDEGLELHNRAGGMPFPYAPGFGPNGSVTGSPESIPDVNMYQNKKTVAQGMIDVALFSANANQLRYVLESSNHPCYYPGIVLITFSMLFQVAVGIGLLWNTRYDVKDEREICIANKVNNFTIVGIFLVTVINVFISAFGTTAGATSAPVT